MNTQIEQFHISRLTQGAHYSFHFDVYQYIMTATPAILHVETQTPLYKELIDKQRAIINLATNTPMTDELKAADYERDRWLGQFFVGIDAAAISLDPTIAAAGQLVKKAIAPYRGIAGNEYTKQTAQIDGMTRDLGPDKYTDALDTLNLAATLQKVRQANTKFKLAYTQRITEESEEPRPEANNRENRKEMDTAYAEIVKIVNAFAIAAPAEAITTFVNMVNARIAETKLIISRQRAGGTGNEKLKEQQKKAMEKTSKAQLKVDKLKFDLEKAEEALRQCIEAEEKLRG